MSFTVARWSPKKLATSGNVRNSGASIFVVMNKGWQQHARERWMVGLALSADSMASLSPWTVSFGVANNDLVTHKLSTTLYPCQGKRSSPSPMKHS